MTTNLKHLVAFEKVPGAVTRGCDNGRRPHPTASHSLGRISIAQRPPTRSVCWKVDTASTDIKPRSTAELNGGVPNDQTPSEQERCRACVPIASDVDCVGGSGNGPESYGATNAGSPTRYAPFSCHHVQRPWSPELRRGPVPWPDGAESSGTGTRLRSRRRSGRATGSFGARSVGVGDLPLDEGGAGQPDAAPGAPVRVAVLPQGLARPKESDE